VEKARDGNGIGRGKGKGGEWNLGEFVSLALGAIDAPG